MVANSLQQAKAGKKSNIAVYLTNDAVKSQINNIVGGKQGPRFVTALTSAVMANPQLSDCANASIVNAALLGTALNLSPSPQLGQFYMVPFNDRKHDRKVAQFVLGYKGYIQLAIRSGQYKKLNVLSIKEGELVRFDPLNEDIEVNLIEDEDERESTPTIGYYAFFEYINGFRKAMYWSKDKMIRHADRYSQAFSMNATGGRYPKVSYADYEAGKYNKNDEWLYSSFWYKDFDGMAYKTMLRQLISKWGIMSIDMVTAIDADGGVIGQDGHVDYVDNEPAEDEELTESHVEGETQPALEQQAPEEEKKPSRSSRKKSAGDATPQDASRASQDEQEGHSYTADDKTGEDDIEGALFG